MLAVGGNLSSQRLLQAYHSGIFPWYEAGQPILWWSPDPRMVLFPKNLKVSKSMKQVLRKNQFQITFNKAFERIMENCAEIDRKHQDGTWITSEMVDSYLVLHQLGWAISVEVWQQQKLVGGLYGIYLKDKKVFCGESMFSKSSNASKVALIHLVEKFPNLRLIDCQVYTQHLESLGAEEISRKAFLEHLE